MYYIVNIFSTKCFLLVNKFLAPHIIGFISCRNKRTIHSLLLSTIPKF